MKNPRGSSLSVLEAVDQLTSMVEVDSAAMGEGAEEARRWLDPSRVEVNQRLVRDTFKTVHGYLEEIVKGHKRELEDPEMQKGIQAMMLLVGEAGEKLTRYTDLFKTAHPDGGVSDTDEFRKLQQFYFTQILRKLQEALKEKRDEERKISDAEVKDISGAKDDEAYELFLIKREDGSSYFTADVLRHVKLVGDIDKLAEVVEGEDPFIKIKLVQDHDAYSSAVQIRKWASSQIDQFYKEAFIYRELAVVTGVNKALMALFLASNNRNLLDTTEGKCCLGYYVDFQNYLREVIGTKSYHKLLEKMPEEPFFHRLLNLVHTLCSMFFMRLGSHRDALELIHSMVGYEKSNTWQVLIDEDHHLREVLKKFPNGPLLKAIDSVRLDEEHKKFDPLKENAPASLYNIAFDNGHVSMLRLASPTKQEFIDQVEIVDEFKGFIHSLSGKFADEKHLLINLQERSSWRERARASVLEKMQNQGEFSHNLSVASIPKNGDFYWQRGEYEQVYRACDFMDLIKEMMFGEKESEFFFPRRVEREVEDFTKECLPLIHKSFFSGKNVLSCDQRCDFLEIFNIFLSLKLIDLLRPASMSFSCKDAIDQGIVTSAEIYLFLRLFLENPWSEKENDFLLWMLYSPALTLRERSLDPRYFKRMVSSLCSIEIGLKEKEFKGKFKNLYSSGFFNKMNIAPSSD